MRSISTVPRALCASGFARLPPLSRRAPSPRPCGPFCFGRRCTHAPHSAWMNMGNTPRCFGAARRLLLGQPAFLWTVRPKDAILRRQHALWLWKAAPSLLRAAGCVFLGPGGSALHIPGAEEVRQVERLWPRLQAAVDFLRGYQIRVGRRNAAKFRVKAGLMDRLPGYVDIVIDRCAHFFPAPPPCISLHIYPLHYAPASPACRPASRPNRALQADRTTADLSWLDDVAVSVGGRTIASETYIRRGAAARGGPSGNTLHAPT